MAEWWSIEVLHGEFSAYQWEAAYSSELIEAALTNGALDATWHSDTWGVAFEVRFDDADLVARVPRPARRPGGAGLGARPGQRAADLPRPGRQFGRGQAAETAPGTECGGRGAARA